MNASPPASRSPLLRWLLPGLAVLCLATAGLWLIFTQVLRPQAVTYAQFQALLDTGQVSRVVIQESRATVNLRPPARPTSVSLRLPSSLAVPDSPLIAELDRQNVEYQFQTPGQWLNLFLAFLPLLLLLGVPAFCLTIFLLWLMRRRAAPENLSER